MESKLRDMMQRHSACGNDEVRSDLALAHRILAYEQLNEGTWTHLSVVAPDSPRRMMVSPGDRHFADIDADDILTLDEHGRVMQGDGEPNISAWCLHYPIHELRPDAICIIHMHSLYATALMMQKTMRLNERGSQAAATFYGEIAYYDAYDGTLTQRSEGEAMGRALGDRSVLVLRNHGSMVVGWSIDIAVERAYIFERACRLQLLAESSGRSLNEIPGDVVQAIHDEENAALGAYFGGMKRLLAKRRGAAGI